MEKYHYKTVVEADGSILLSGLPPHQEVEVVLGFKIFAPVTLLPR